MSNEGPEYNTESLSPVSPKPVHYQSPANVPVLENQMDPVFNDTATHEPKANEASVGSVASNPAADSGFPTLQSPDQLNQIEVADTTMHDVSDMTGQPASAEIDLGVNGYNEASTGELATNPNDASAFTSHSVHDNTTTQSQSDVPSITTTDVNAHQSGPLTDAVPSQTIDSTTLPFSESIPQQQNGTSVTQSPFPNLEGVDYQALLNSINVSAFATAAPTADDPTITARQPANASPAEAQSEVDDTSAAVLTPSSLIQLPTGTALPIRPRSQTAQPPSIDSSTDPKPAPDHDTAAATTAPRYAPLANAAPPPLLTAGAPGTSSVNIPILVPPPAPDFQPQAVPGSDTRTGPETEQLGPKEDENIKWGPDTQAAYDAFLTDERNYVMEGKWENFPVGSRLFLGNLSSERTTKRDLFHVFHKYGKLAQLSIKSNFGFAQFLTAEDCKKALESEQDVSIRGRKIHLEISKPARSSRTSTDTRAGRNRRSPSLDRNRARGAAIDRYVSAPGRTNRGQDNYRPTRSRSPLGRRRSPERYRQRSRSPPSRARHRYGEGEELPMPQRPPQHVPEVQIIVKGQPDRGFVDYVKRALVAKGLRLDEMYLGERFSEKAVIHRQIVEGVLGVVRLTPAEQHRQQFQVTIFDRSQGSGNVRFEEYTDVSLDICAGLLVRAKQNHQARTNYNMPPRFDPSPSMMQPSRAFPPPAMPPAASPSLMQPNRGFAPPYQAQGQYSAQSPYPGPSPTAVSSTGLGGMDNASLQQLLANVQRSQTTPQPPPQPPSYATYGGYGQNQAAARPAAQQPPSQQPNFGGQYGISPTSYGQATAAQNQQPYQQRQSPGQKAPDINAIMAQLGKYGG